MRSVLAVSITTGTRLNFLISRQTSNPSRDGSITSRITASKPPERALASPCRPSIAVATRKPAAFSPIDTISRIDASSSTSSRRSSTLHPVSPRCAPSRTVALYEKCYFAATPHEVPRTEGEAPRVRSEKDPLFRTGSSRLLLSEQAGRGAGEEQPVLGDDGGDELRRGDIEGVIDATGARGCRRDAKDMG